MELQEVRDFAVGLAREAGDLAVAEAANVETMAKGVTGDVVTWVDQESERRIVAAIHAVFPDHAVLGEESGWHGPPGAEHQWLVDPLDGTNNYVLGLGCYGVCITLCRGDEPMVAVVHDARERRTFAAAAGLGATCGGVAIEMAEPGPLSHVTVSWLEGYEVSYDDPYRRRTFEQLERSCRRVLRTWAPSIDWGLLAAGKVAALVAYRNEAWDLVGGAFIAHQAGAELRTSPDGEAVLVTHPSLVGELSELTGCTDDPLAVGGRGWQIAFEGLAHPPQ